MVTPQPDLPHRDHASGLDHAPATRVVTLGRPAPEPQATLGPAVHLTSTYVARPGGAAPGDLVYGRWGNPTWDAFEQTLGALEGGHALAFASGLAAVDAVIRQVPLGGVVVASQASYNGTVVMLDEAAKRGLLSVRWVPIDDTESVEAALPGADLLWVESPTNPLLEIADVPVLVAAARSRGTLVAVDNTFATPLLQRPLELGADVVVHSVTKYLSGHSDLVLGATVTRDATLAQRLHAVRTQNGAIPGTFETWLALRGMRTLALRVERSGANAAELARRLQGHRALTRVRHPSLPDDPGHARATAQMSGYGSIISIETAGGAEAAERLCATTRLWVMATSLGGVESTLERRRRHGGEPAVVPPELIRLSVGIEDVEDLWADLEQALAAL
jgi:cystathionine gamma-synthase